MNRAKLIIFDMDGLMFDTEKISFEAWNYVLKEHGYEFSMTFFTTMVGSNYERIRELCKNKYGAFFPFDQVMMERAQFTNEYVTKHGVPIKKGLKELLKYLKTTGVKMAVATSSGRDRADLFLNNAKVQEFFEYVLCGDEVTKSKPDPEIFLTVSTKFGIDSDKVIVLEDSILGIQAAYKAGMNSIMVPDMVQPDEETLIMASACFSSLLEVIDYFKSQ